MSGRRNDPAWHEARRQGIGGSDAPAILGVSPWRTPYDVWAEKIGADTGAVRETDAMRWGLTLEPVVRAEYARVTGRAVQVVDEILHHPQHEWLIANIDGRVDDGRVLEIKTARSTDGWGEPGTDQIPLYYLPQAHHYLIVTGAPVCDVAVLIGGSDFRVYSVEADADLHTKIIEVETTFWDLVQRREPPPAITVHDAVERWGHAARQGIVTADAEALAAIEQIRQADAALHAATEQRDAARAVVLCTLADQGDTLVDSAGRILCTWKMQAGAEYVVKREAARVLRLSRRK